MQQLPVLLAYVVAVVGRHHEERMRRYEGRDFEAATVVVTLWSYYHVSLVASSSLYGRLPLCIQIVANDAVAGGMVMWRLPGSPPPPGLSAPILWSLSPW